MKRLALLAGLLACPACMMIMNETAHVYESPGELASGDLDAALSTLDGAIQAEPANAGARQLRGMAYLAAGYHQDAIADFEEARKLNPKDANSLRMQGVAYYQSGRFGKAVTVMDQLLQTSPRDAEAYKLRGRAHLADAKVDRAIADFTQAVRLRPNDADANLALSEAYAIKGKFANVAPLNPTPVNVARVQENTDSSNTSVAQPSAPSRKDPKVRPAAHEEPASDEQQ